MNICLRDVLKLKDGKTYEVINKMLYEEITYYYLVDIKNSRHIKFCMEDKDELVEITDINLLKTLIPILTGNTKDNLTLLLTEMN